MLSILTPPSTCSAIGWPPAWVQASIRARASRSSQGAGDEALAAEAGVHRHEQHQVDLVHHVVHQRQRRGRVEHQSGLAALLADQRQRAVHVAAGLRVEADVVGAGLGEHGHQLVHRLDHEVHVDGHRHVRADRRTDHRADGQVGHVVVVHHVEVDPVGAGGDDVAHFLAQAGEVGGQDAGSDAGGVRHGVRGAGGHNVPLLQFGARSREKPLRRRPSAVVRQARRQRVLERPGVAPGAARVHHPHTGRTVKPYDLSVSVSPRFVPEQSDPGEHQFVFAYTVRITNTGEHPAQVISRHWIITDGNQRVQEVRGLGVVGQQPCWRPARPSNTPAAARCPPRWARCAAPIIASARTASRSRCRFPNSSWRCRVPCTDAARRLFSGP